MRSKAFLLPICSIFVISVASPTQVASQMPRAAITGLARDSIGLQLTRPAYVAVFERLAHKAVHVLYPPLDQDWAALASGPNTIRVTSTLLRALAAKPDLTRQCIVEPTQTMVWDPEARTRSAASRAACGPSPATSSVTTAYPSIDTDEAYLIVVTLDADHEPSGLGGISNAYQPVEFIQWAGQRLAARASSSRTWQGLILRLR